MSQSLWHLSSAFPPHPSRRWPWVHGTGYMIYGAQELFGHPKA
jgi:hypothetical protein